MEAETSDQREKEEEAKPKKQWFGRKTKVKLLLLLIVIVLIMGGWLYVQRTWVKLQGADEVLQENKILQEEKQRCATLIQQQSGDFGEYEYCTRLLKKF